ncbi:hypothetical protein SAMN05421841_2044 [Chryseobacterium wanjuense]|uniref:EpsG family protein n=1 Tax=Chryseobacterium wanjuense TaxID=356305 RepID=A0A1I0QPB5_9FLAO|nr:hypothetical protein [Chryseobacterium wanjuense]SEW29080.1 hypothetical protein SAMN05421841_2044 [Chryseobacterium wanjuense]
MNRKVLLVLLYLYALVFSVLKTIRFPNDWSEAHWMLDYRFGFIKRGLAGEIFGWIFEKNEFNILILSAVILFLLYVSVFIIAVKETFKQENSFYRIFFFLIFFLSQYIVFSAHLIGYLDHIIFLLTILVIYFIKQKKILLSSAIAAICILIHEVSFFLMLPVSCFALVVTEIGVEKFSLKNIFSADILKKLVVFLILPFFTAISVTLYQEWNGENYFSVIFNYLKEIPFISEKAADSVASAYTKSFTYYFKEESGSFIQRLFFSRATILYGIPILFSLWMIFKEFKLKQNIQLFLLLMVVSFIPLLLHAIAYDTYRIWSFPFMILLLVFWILSSKITIKKEKTRKLSTLEIIFFSISLGLVSLIPNVLMDNEVERFSLIVRLIIIVPIFLILYFLKKPQPN